MRLDKQQQVLQFYKTNKMNISGIKPEVNRLKFEIHADGYAELYVESDKLTNGFKVEATFVERLNKNKTVFWAFSMIANPFLRLHYFYNSSGYSTSLVLNFFVF